MKFYRQKSLMDAEIRKQVCDEKQDVYIASK